MTPRRPLSPLCHSERSEESGPPGRSSLHPRLCALCVLCGFIRHSSFVILLASLASWRFNRPPIRKEEPVLIDLYSDTATKPTAAMRRAIAEAEVGDEQKGEDPTVNRLQAMVAELLGKEAALYLPSGTMCNEIAIRVHTRHGDEVLLDRTAHPIHFEAGGPGILSGVILTGLDGVRGVFSAAQVAAAIRPPNRHSPPTRLVSIENTS